MIKGLKKTEVIVKNIRETLNSPKVQEMFGSEFSKMSPEVKTDFITVILYKLCEGNKELMDIVASEMYEELRQN